MHHTYRGSKQSGLPRRPTRREALKAGVALVAGPVIAAGAACTADSPETSDGKLASQWLSYAGDKASSKYSSLAQIDSENFRGLTVAWKWRSPDEAITRENPNLRTWAWESTPLMVDGVLYASTSMAQVAAIDAATGETVWLFDPEAWKNGTPSNNGFVHRGVAYWADGDDQRILFGTGDGYLICLNANTGEPIATFGEQGRVDLTQGLGRPVNRDLYGVSSPPIVCRDVVVMGSKVHDVPVESEMPPGDVRGFDVRTGRQLWVFHSIPQVGEYGHETWAEESWRTTGAANAWTMMSADEELGYVYVPFGTPANDFYGGGRPGDGLFGESLVCLDALTGQRIWHFQIAHHGVWDYDLPAAPNLVDVTVNDEPVKAVAQVTKQAFVYVFDRVTGEPIWPMEERPVPQSSIPGERSSATQPFPTKPAPFDRQGVSEDDVIDFTPALREQALAVLSRYNYGPLFTPHSLEKPTIEMPGWAGGASWAGAAFDPETGIAYVSSVTSPLSVTISKPDARLPVPFVGSPAPMETMQGVPLWKPPYGRVTAIDLNTGEHRWMAPLGDLARSNPVLRDLDLPPVGRPARGHLLLTKTLLIVGQEGVTRRQEIDPREPDSQQESPTGRDFVAPDPGLVAFDKATGEVVGEVSLQGNATGAPMTYTLNGKQFIAVPTGGADLPAELIVLSLP